jgi:putative lipase involved disintegration of autophagic bodies
MIQEEALRTAKNWYNARPDEQQATINYLYEQKENYTEQMSWLIGRIQSIDTLIACLLGQSKEIPEVFLKAFEANKEFPEVK